MNYHINIRVALRGIIRVWRQERSLRIECLYLFLSYGILYVIGVRSLALWGISLVFSMSILVLEMINSVIERLIDVLKPQFQDTVRDIKDIAAGAVLFTGLFYALFILFLLINKVIA